MSDRSVCSIRGMVVVLMPEPCRGASIDSVDRLEAEYLGSVYSSAAVCSSTCPPGGKGLVPSRLLCRLAAVLLASSQGTALPGQLAHLTHAAVVSTSRQRPACCSFSTYRRISSLSLEARPGTDMSIMFHQQKASSQDYRKGRCRTARA